MRKKLLLAAAATVTLSGMFGLAACEGCNDGGHTHNYGAWKSDKVYHWHECKNAGCDEKIKDKTAHADTDNDGECDECGYFVGTIGHTHDYSTEWSSDGTYHWHECQNAGCDAAVIDKEIHFDASADGFCDECGESVESGSAVHEHPLTFYAKTDASCTMDGNSAYYACSSCNKIFFDARGTNEIIDKSIVMIARIPHDLTFNEETEPSCTETGNTAYYSCSYCARWFTDADGEDEITDKSTAVIAPRHNLTLVPLTLPTCIEDGNEAYYICETCEKWFSDENGENEITDKTSVIITERADHIYDGKICTVCGEVKPTEGLKYTDKGDYYEVSLGDATDVDIVIPAVYEGKPVTAIADDAFRIPFLVINEEGKEEVEYRGYNMASITIPDSITHIGNRAFYGCGNLVTVTLPDSLGYIGEEVFFGCSSLQIVDTGKGITAIGKDAFRNCLSLTTINISDKVTHIGQGAFYRCPVLTDITIPAATNIIGENAFELCENLTIYCEATSKPESWVTDWNRCSGGVLIDGKLTEKVFCPVVWDCKNNDLAEDGNIYTVSGRIKYTIKDGTATVVYQSLDLSGEVEILSSVTYKGKSYPVAAIAASAFSGCTSLTSLTIPASVAYIGANAFDRCSALTIYCKAKEKPEGWEDSDDGKWNNSKCPVVWDCDKNAVASDGYIYVVVDGLRYTLNALGDKKAKIVVQPLNLSGDITIPETITYLDEQYKVDGIGDAAFSGCTSITTVTVSYGITFIGYGSFSGCISLNKVTISGTVGSIGVRAFSGCTSLTEIKYNGSKDGWSSIRKGANWNENTAEYTVYCNSGVTVSKNEE